MILLIHNKIASQCKMHISEYALSIGNIGGLLIRSYTNYKVNRKYRRCGMPAWVSGVSRGKGGREKPKGEKAKGEKCLTNTLPQVPQWTGVGSASAIFINVTWCCHTGHVMRTKYVNTLMQYKIKKSPSMKLVLLQVFLSEHHLNQALCPGSVNFLLVLASDTSRKFKTFHKYSY